jgi:hypothetical protein
VSARGRGGRGHRPRGRRPERAPARDRARTRAPDDPRRRRRAPDWRVDLLILLAAFVIASALAGLLGAANLGTTLTFGQIAFAAALVYVLLRR